jgi:hypothetical protein
LAHWLTEMGNPAAASTRRASSSSGTGSGFERQMESAGTLPIPALDAVLAVYHLRAEPSAMTMLASETKANRTRMASNRSRALLIT